MGEDGLLSSTEVAARLGVHPTTVQKIPASRLPYTTSPGGPRRGGRRRYRPEDVDAYLERSATLDARVTALEERMAAVEDELRGQ